MKLTFEDLMQYGSAPEFPETPLSPDQMERIREKTMKQIHQPNRRQLRPVRILVAAAMVTILLCGSVFAAYTNGWFDQLFGTKTEVVAENIVTYPEPTEAPPAYTPAPEVEYEKPSTQEEAEALAQAESVEEPDWEEILKVSEVYAADTQDYRFTLESMLVGKESIYAVLKMEPLTDFGRDNMELDISSGLYLAASNLTHQEGGSVHSAFISHEDDASYYLVTHTGGNNQVGDVVEFQALSIPDSDGNEYAAFFFNAEVTSVVDSQKVIELDRSVYDDYNYFTTLTVTPMSLTIEGWFDHEAYEAGYVQISGDIWQNDMPEPLHPVVSIALTDGTTFSLEEIWTPYGTYGASTCDIHSSKETNIQTCTWNFSQFVNLDEIGSITVDGVTYTME